MLEDDQQKVARPGRAADTLGLNWPTVNSAIQRLEELEIAHEVTSRARDRLYAYKAQLDILNAGTEPLNGQDRR